MDRERDKFLKVLKYIQSLGVLVNVSKNKARGNKGIFFLNNNANLYRIDISEAVNDSERLSVLLHEFAHYIHYKYDKTMQSLDFIFPELSDSDEDELIKVTVDTISQKNAALLIDTKKKLISENKEYVRFLKQKFPNFVQTSPFKDIEVKIKKPFNYFFKYDLIKFNQTLYDIRYLQEYNLEKFESSYIKLKSNQNKIKKINSKINRLNKYYNQFSELWARFFEMYFFNNDAVLLLAPNICSKMDIIIHRCVIDEVVQINNILHII